MRLFKAIFLVGISFVNACKRQEPEPIPNRALDRPLDLTFACVVVNGETELIEPVSMNLCDFQGALEPSCSERDVPQLIGFVANSERNEVAMVRRCLGGNLVDVDPNSPGFNFISVGQLPSSIALLPGGCQAVTANAGSCDLSVLEVPGLSSFALGVKPVQEPGSMVSTLIPKRGDSSPLAARPGQILAVPTNLTNSVALEDSEDTGGDDLALNTCKPGVPQSVYVTFPSCQLVAEVDLLTQQILQSRQFKTTENGIEVIDTGTNPECPIDCPSQFETAIPDSPAIDPNGVYPLTMTLIAPPENPEEADDADSQIEDYALIVGGIGSDSIFEFDYNERQWQNNTLQLPLDEAKGVITIRHTPAMTLIDDGQGTPFYQFLYVIAGDGTTRIVRRELSTGRAEIGVECETQIDPTSVSISELICEPSFVDNPSRRPFVQSPGVLAPGRAIFTDWVFQKVKEEDIDPEQGASLTPFASPGVVGIGVTNVGTLAFTTFGQFIQGVSGLAFTELFDDFDPLGTLNIRVSPHMLWPQITDPTLGQTAILPRVENKEPERVITGEQVGVNALKLLAPTLRRIDLAYANQSESEDAQIRPLLSGANDSPIANADGLGTNDESDVGVDAIYSKPVVRVVSRDYRAWDTMDWRLSWEGEIPTTESLTGQIKCDRPSSNKATCEPESDGEARVVDDRAVFCDQGVLAGDKVVILGCIADRDCGLGQVCLRDPLAAVNATGICISEQASENSEEMLAACGEFVRDPCGLPIREYLITRAFQDELWLQSLELPYVAYLRETSTMPEDGKACMPCGQGQENCFLCEEEAQFRCLEDQPSGGCTTRSDCSGSIDNEDIHCIDGFCQEICQDGQNCKVRSLPGPRCFAELTHYQINAHQSFVLQGQGDYSFISSRVYADENGECFENPNVSELLTSRIRLGKTEEDTRNHETWPIPSCPDGSIPSSDAPNPCFIEDVRPSNPSSGITGSLFHFFRYGGQDTGGPVPAIRFSNPMLTVVLDLASLSDLGQEIPDRPGEFWPAAFRNFSRSRIPRQYQERFTTLAGYQPYNPSVELQIVSLGAQKLVGPVRMINGEEKRVVYIVDGSGGGSTLGVRGQVLRVPVGAPSPTLITADSNFVVR